MERIYTGMLTIRSRSKAGDMVRKMYTASLQLLVLWLLVESGQFKLIDELLYTSSKLLQVQLGVWYPMNVAFRAI